MNLKPIEHVESNSSHIGWPNLKIPLVTSYSTMPLTQEDNQLLNDFVRCIFNQWYGLQAALQHGMGGTPAQTQSKLDGMIAQIAHSCSRLDVCEEELSDELEDTVDACFDVIFEDGSVDQVAHELWSVTRDLLAGNKDKILTFVNKSVTLPAPTVPASSESADEDEDEDEDDDEDDEDDDEDEDEDEEMDTSNADDAQEPKCSHGPDDEGWEVPRYARRKR